MSITATVPNVDQTYIRKTAADAANSLPNKRLTAQGATIKRKRAESPEMARHNHKSARKRLTYSILSLVRALTTAGNKEATIAPGKKPKSSVRRTETS